MPKDVKKAKMLTFKKKKKTALKAKTTPAKSVSEKTATHKVKAKAVKPATRRVGRPQKSIATTKPTLRLKSRGEMRFALYLRKSTEEDERQVNSIEDQERICRDFALRQGDINIVEVFKEQKSAAYANNREKFNEMVSMVEDGKLDGIVAYHPDRLSRNMLEAGKLLDMLKPAKGEVIPALQALVFPSVAFNNDSGGRLMLAVLFSMATQYSEHLSEVVQHGVSSNLSKGISSGTPKWGYQRNAQTQHYEPDKNFNVIKQGWQMALDGKSQVEILDFWKKHGVSRITKGGKGKAPIQKFLGNTSSVSKLFHDPIYMGTLCQKDQEVNLLDIDPDFKPMVSEEEYNKVQALFDSKSHTHKPHKGVVCEFTMFKGGIIRCAECGSPLQGYYGGHSKDHRFLYYGHRSKTPESKKCPRCTEETYITQIIDGKEKQVKVAKEIRANVILDALYKVLDDLKPTKADYEKYLAVANQYATEKTDELRIEKRSLSGRLTHLRKEMSEEERSYKAISLIPNTPEATLNSSAQRLMALQNEIIDLEDEIA